MNLEDFLLGIVDSVAETLVSIATGGPGVSAAKFAVKKLHEHLKKRQAWKELEKKLQEVIEEFRQKARDRGWDRFANAITELPLFKEGTFKVALKYALAEGDISALRSELEKELASLEGVDDPGAAAEAARLYAALILDVLWKIGAFREAARDILLREQSEVLGRIEDAIKRLPRWWRLIPAVQRLPRGRLLADGNIPLAALKAPLRLVPLVGRREELEGLEEWALSLDGRPSRAGIRILWGPGGVGKTRLAVELAKRLQAQGWEAFFLHPDLLRGDDPARIHLAPEAVIWLTPLCPTLYILDYAEQVHEDLIRAFLETFYTTSGKRRKPVALLLLMRQRPTEIWVNSVTAVVGPDVKLGDFLDQEIFPALSEPMEVRPLPREELPRLFEVAKDAFVKLRGREPENSITYAEEELPDRPLPVVLLGLLAAYGRRVPKSRDEEAIFRELWERWEKPKWRRILEREGLKPAWWEDAARMLETALIAATLGRIFRDFEDLADFWRKHDPPRRKTPEGITLDPDWLAQQGPHIFPRSGEEPSLVPPIEPDPLADFVLSRRADLPDIVRAVLSPLPPLSPQALVNTLSRLYGFMVERKESTALVEEAVRQVEEGVLKVFQALEGRRGLFKLWALMWHVNLPPPNRTVLWRGVRAIVDRKRAELAEDETERAETLHNLGVTLSALGRHEEALEVTEEAVEIYRELSEKNPDRFRPDLAMSLSNLGSDLSALGRHEEALEVTREAVEIYRELAQKNPDRFLPDLAMSLSNLGNRLSALGRHEEALEVTREAVEIYRKLAGKNPQAYEPDLSRSLGVLGTVLLGLGRPGEAAREFAEGLRILLPHARALPGAHKGLLGALLRGYLRASEAAGEAPDEELVRQAQEIIDDDAGTEP